MKSLSLRRSALLVVGVAGERSDTGESGSELEDMLGVREEGRV
jgi:hypothetical protein